MTNHVRSVFLIRHGRTSYNAAHKLQGQVDIPLDAVGEWQVKQTLMCSFSTALRRGRALRHTKLTRSTFNRLS